MTKPFVLVCATPISNHVIQARSVAKDLVSRGYEVTFISSEAFRKQMEEFGATFTSISGYGDYPENFLDVFPDRDSYSGINQMVWDMKNVFCRAIPSQHECIQRALKAFQTKDANRPVVLICEAAFWGTTPTLLGAPGLSPAGSIALGVFPLTFTDEDVSAFGPGTLPDTSPEGKARNIASHKFTQEVLLADVQAEYQSMLREVGAQPSPYFFLDSQAALSDRFLQLCIPSAEYPRHKMPAGVRFVGSLPNSQLNPWTARPSWWDEVTINSQKKRIVAVCQGTVVLDYNNLITPTLEALKDVPNTLVLVALGKKGATLPSDIVIPENARVLDYIPFEDLLPYSDVFVTNGGYGGFMHAIASATPLVLGGDTEDKPEVAARAEYAGVGYNLRTATPTPDQVRVAVEEILAEPKYKIRALELQAESKTYDAFALIAAAVDELAEGK